MEKEEKKVIKRPPKPKTPKAKPAPATPALAAVVSDQRPIDPNMWEWWYADQIPRDLLAHPEHRPTYTKPLTSFRYDADSGQWQATWQRPKVVARPPNAPWVYDDPEPDTIGTGATPRQAYEQMREKWKNQDEPETPEVPAILFPR